MISVQFQHEFWHCPIVQLSHDHALVPIGYSRLWSDGYCVKTSRDLEGCHWNPRPETTELVSNMFEYSGSWFGTFFFPYIGTNHPNWLSYFSEGLKRPTRTCFRFIPNWKNVLTSYLTLLYEYLTLYIWQYGYGSKPFKPLWFTPVHSWDFWMFIPPIKIL